MSSASRRTARSDGILRCVAENGGGLLLSANNADELSDALFTILEELEVVSTTGFLEIEAFDDLWPAATAACTGPCQRLRSRGRRR